MPENNFINLIFTYHNYISLSFSQKLFHFNVKSYIRLEYQRYFYTSSNRRKKIVNIFLELRNCTYSFREKSINLIDF